MKITKGVYCLTSPSGKRYVGVAYGKNGIEGRWNKYRKLQCKQQKAIYNALKKYGPENFKYEIVLETDDIDNMKRSEMYLIDIWDTQNPEKGYNRTNGGDGFICRVGAWNEGIKGLIKASEETKKKMSISLKGKKRTEETKKKISDAQRSKNSMAGKIPWNKDKSYENKKNQIIRKFLNEKTGEIIEGCGSILGKIHNFSAGNIIKHGKSKGWRLINE